VKSLSALSVPHSGTAAFRTHVTVSPRNRSARSSVVRGHFTAVAMQEEFVAQAESAERCFRQTTPPPGYNTAMNMACSGQNRSLVHKTGRLAQRQRVWYRHIWRTAGYHEVLTDFLHLACEGWDRTQADLCPLQSTPNHRQKSSPHLCTSSTARLHSYNIPRRNTLRVRDAVQPMSPSYNALRARNATRNPRVVTHTDNGPDQQNYAISQAMSADVSSCARHPLGASSTAAPGELHRPSRGPPPPPAHDSH
jgi:hypothetical protein